MGVAERKQREKEARTEAIKHNAIELFAKKGYESTTMAEIAEETEIAKGTIYRFFKSKAELLFCLIEPPMTEYYQQLSNIVMHDVNEAADVTLAKILDHLLESYRRSPESYQIMMYYKADEIEPLFSNKRLTHLKNLMRKNLRKVEELISRGIEQGVFRPVNPKPASTIIWNMALGILQFEQNRAYSGGKDYLTKTMEQAKDILLSGLKT